MATQEETVAEEPQQEEIVSPQEDVSSSSQTPQDSSLNTQSQEDEKEDSKELNFKKLREKANKLEEENRQFVQRIKEYESRLEHSETLSEGSGSSKEQELPLGEEDLVEGRHLKKVLTQLRMEQIPQRLKAAHSDFDQVVSKENLEKLKNDEPELFSAIQVRKDVSPEELYTKGLAAYKALKRLGYTKDYESLIKQKEVAQSNHKKPVSTNSLRGGGPIHEANIFANGLTPDLKKQLQKEMAEAIKAR